MNAVEQLLERNQRFARSHEPGQPQMPRLRTCVVTCPDPRVDPAQVLGLELGDAAVVRGRRANLADRPGAQSSSNGAPRCAVSGLWAR